VNQADQLMLRQVRDGDSAAWQQFIARFEGRLLAFANARLANKSLSEDIVQETFIGFLTSLPNYDEGTPVESFLFAIAAHKLTDVLRRQGRRPTVPLFAPTEDGGKFPEPAGSARRASSMMRSREDRTAEQTVVGRCLTSLVEQWLSSGEFERLQCVEPDRRFAARVGGRRLSGLFQKSGQGYQHEAQASEYLFRGRFTRLRFVLVLKTLYRLPNWPTKVTSDSTGVPKQNPSQIVRLREHVDATSKSAAAENWRVTMMMVGDRHGFAEVCCGPCRSTIARRQPLRDPAHRRNDQHETAETFHQRDVVVRRSAEVETLQLHT
jgi:RNA polymerase sigma-70 factor, ECF subfamily